MVKQCEKGERLERLNYVCAAQKMNKENSFRFVSSMGSFSHYHDVFRSMYSTFKMSLVSLTFKKS